MNGSYDFIASNEYMNRPPIPPTFVYCFDVSKQAIDSGYLELCLQTVKNVIESKYLGGGGERTQVAFMAFDNCLHYFNLKSTLKQPQILIVSDTSELFLPLPVSE